jgi:hypothetical protein
MALRKDPPKPSERRVNRGDCLVGADLDSLDVLGSVAEGKGAGKEVSSVILGDS